MKKPKKFKDELTRRDSKRIEKKLGKQRKRKLNPSDNRRPKYHNTYLTEEE